MLQRYRTRSTPSPLPRPPKNAPKVIQTKRTWYYPCKGWDLPGLGGGVSGPKPQKSEKSLEKVLGPSGPKSLKKVSGRVRKVSKKPPFLEVFFETFRTRPETFFRPLGPEGPRTFSRLFSDFWGFGPETPPPRPGRSQPLHG